jgi:hypothetical protein
MDSRYIGCNAFNRIGIQAEFLWPHQRFTRQFQEYTSVFQLSGHGCFFRRGLNYFVNPCLAGANIPVTAADLTPDQTA